MERLVPLREFCGENQNDTRMGDVPGFCYEVFAIAHDDHVCPLTPQGG